ncbi:hypothetical protein TVAG_020590 [Trichomonas vaginalis G3]|uniref:DUF3447 domain-containing protein n=1 Tax=Trichomonas vaginalis (strain ATCC PRA-98 / G3) TaxID=412133 RepID=A2EXX3_TRIV3|nr:ankyrin repeat and SOCS box-containing protein 4 family [Trichomonas vaginalis G3]EAY02506.1 hypothetical protein TVAG_020590 [Trichomonas vaginalis G3]KAI5529082.1 ankyrin repeat and SOCS box-containing protein 4 family [Trichomonas vaginalis G3]|eukprot:XP_001314745.1 hypothetical protein [Trichomonas vaginalis G3]
MSEQCIPPDKYLKLRDQYKYYIDSYNALYQLKTENEEDLNKIYKMIRTELIDSKKFIPQNIIKDILNIIPYKNRYTKSYLYLAKLIYDDYHVKEVINVNTISKFLFYKEYGIRLDNSGDFERIRSGNLDIHTEDTIYRAIMYNDLERFIIFTEREGFDKNQMLISKLYSNTRYSLLELCCYHGAVDCFKFLRTKFNSSITYECLEYSFLGGNPEIMSECLKYKEPVTYPVQKNAIISHNIDFITFLMNEYNVEIYLEYCAYYNNLEAFLVYFDRTNDINLCFVYSSMFNIPSLCKYFLSRGADINAENRDEQTALHCAALKNSKETAKFLISRHININKKDDDGHTPLHKAAIKNSRAVAQLLISHGANISVKDKHQGQTALLYAAYKNSKETAEILISHGININEKDNNRETALHKAAHENSKETAELLISHGINIDEKCEYGGTALHIAAYYNKETVELLISHGANVNEKDNEGKTPLHNAAQKMVKKQLNFLFHMVQMSMKKINMEEQLFIKQHRKMVKKQLKFLFHMVQIFMKKIKID